MAQHRDLQKPRGDRLTLFHIKTFPPKGEPFELASVLEADAPTGTDGNDWHRYVITQGENTIVGYRQGTQPNVRLAIEEIVLQLNERRVGTRGRVNLIPSPKKRA